MFALYESSGIGMNESSKLKKKKQKTKNNFIIGIKDSESILNDNRRYKGNHTDMPTSIVCIVITSQRRMISASITSYEKKKERKKESRAKCCDNKKLI
jgi:hypothetical protein